MFSCVLLISDKGTSVSYKSVRFFRLLFVSVC